MTRRIELEVDGVTATARLNEEGAPVTVQRLWDALPIEEKMRHVRWGGSAAYILARQLRDPSLPFEDRISFYLPATIAFKPQHGELAFSYGQAQARDPLDFGWATPLAVLEGDSGPILEKFAGTLANGATTLTIRRIEA
jgi:hypothetical protein